MFEWIFKIAFPRLCIGIFEPILFIPSVLFESLFARNSTVEYLRKQSSANPQVDYSVTEIFKHRNICHIFDRLTSTRPLDLMGFHQSKRYAPEFTPVFLLFSLSIATRFFLKWWENCWDKPIPKKENQVLSTGIID